MRADHVPEIQKAHAASKDGIAVTQEYDMRANIKQHATKPRNAIPIIRYGMPNTNTKLHNKQKHMHA